MRLQELNEGLSSVLYHYVKNANDVIEILRSNRFRLNAFFGPAYNEKELGKKYYYLSTTRSKLGSYHSGPHIYSGTMLVLDGRKLAHNHTGMPFEYWNDVHHDEMEDRIVSDQPFIENAKNYITSIHILHKYDRDVDSHGQRYLRAYFEAKKSGIPTYFYNSNKSWVLLDTRNAIKPDLVDLWRDKSITYTSRVQKKNYLARWIEPYFKKSVEEMTEAARDITYYLKYKRYAKRTLLDMIEADVHNEKRNPTPTLRTLISVMKKEGVRTLDQYLDVLYDKWEVNNNQKAENVDK
jgi:hypothetical protein